MDGSDQILATELVVQIDYEEQSGSDTESESDMKTEFGPDTGRSAAKRVLPEYDESKPKAVKTFQKTDENKARIGRDRVQDGPEDYMFP